MSGKGTAGLGIVAAVILIVWAVTNPGPEQPNNTTTANGSPGSTAFRMAGGSVLGAQAEIATAQTPTLDAMAIEEVLAKYLEESGLSANQEDIQNLVARYNQIANQAQALLSNASPQDLSGLVPSGVAPPQIDPALLASLIQANPQLQSLVQSRLGDRRFAKLDQLTGANQPGATGQSNAGAPGAGGLSSIPGIPSGTPDLSSLNKKKSGSLEDEFFQNAITFQEEVAKLGYK